MRRFTTLVRRIRPALGKMLAIAGRLAREAGAADGFRTIINNGRVGHQEVYHVHMHVLGGPGPAWADASEGNDRRRNMGSLSIWHWLIVLVIVMLIFGTKKLRNMGADLGGAVRGFKDGMREGGEKRGRWRGAAGERQDGRRRSQGQDRAEGLSGRSVFGQRRPPGAFLFSGVRCST